MATLKDILNKNTDCTDDTANTGKLGCQIGFKTPLSFGILKKGTVIPKDTDFNLAYVNSLIAARTLTPVMGATAFEDVSAEDAMSTSSGGIERLNLKGLVKYKFTYEEGHEFYRELSKLQSFKSGSVIFWDEEGNMMTAINSNGDIVGFTSGQINPEMTKRKVQGGDAESKSVTIQLLNRKQTDIDYAVVKASQLGFDAQEDIKGINSATFVYDSVPSAGSEVTAKLVLSSDMDTEVSGITDAADITVEVNGVAAVATSVAEASGVYTIGTAVTVASDKIKVYLTGVANLSDVLYAKGGDADAVVI